MNNRKLETYSLQNQKQITKKQSKDGKSFQLIRRKPGEVLITKKLQIQSYQSKINYPQLKQRPITEKSYLYSPAKGKIQYFSGNQDIVALEILRSKTKLTMKLPNINNLGDKNKNEDMGLIGEGIKKSKKIKGSNQSIEKNINQEGQKKGNSYLKLIKINPIKIQQKKQVNDLSIRDIEDPIQKEQRFRSIIQKNMPPQQIENISKVQKSENNDRTQSRKSSISGKNLISKKQRKALSIIKTNNQNTNNTTKKKYSILYLDFCLFLSLANKMNFPPAPTGNYKAFVGKGNNSILIKNTLKNRFWWNIGEIDNDINFNWTQQRDNKFLQSLKSGQFSQQQTKLNKKISFVVQRPKQNQKNDFLKNQCRVGIGKLISQQQLKKNNSNNFHLNIENKTLGIFESPNKIRLHNHLQFNWNLTNKKALFYNMKAYYLALKLNPFDFIPLTFHVQNQGDQGWQNFCQKFNEKQSELGIKNGDKGKRKKEKNLWIIKPGQNSNQGCGIDVADTLEQIIEIVKSKGVRANGKGRSHIIQRYLMPFLYNKRKFDIRCYILITSVNSIMKAYWYQEGYIRTSCKDFTTKNLKNKFIHLTNDAVQKKSQQYGKYENGNKISFNDFQKYIDNVHPDKNYQFYSTVYPKMMVNIYYSQRLATDAVKSTYLLLDAKKREYSFEIMGLDFMIDEDFSTWLIEVNNNPCLQLGSPLLARIIPNMIQNAFKIALDPLFPPPKDHPKSKTLQTELFESNKFTLIFNSDQEGDNLRNLLNDVKLQGIIESDEEEEGIQYEIQND